MTQLLELESRHGSGVYGSRGLCITRGELARVWDDTGREYVDCTSMYGTTILGHAHPDVTQAVAEQAGLLVACFGSWANDQRAGLYDVLARRLEPLDRFFLCNSGTEAVEAAIKTARHATGRPGVVALAGGFHGRTLGALSLTSRPSYRVPFEPLLPATGHVPAGSLEKLDAALDDDTAALVIETVQGEGGVRPLDPEYLRSAERLCRDRGVLLVVDEVQTGCGRTGRWFGYQHAELEPDLVCIAKGLANGVPIGALAIAPGVTPLPNGTHASTFGGNPLSCAAANATLAAVDRDDLVRRAAELGAWALDRLVAIESPRVRAVRGQGLMLAVDLRERSLPFIRGLQEHGVLALAAGPTVVRFLPPLNIPQEDLARAIDTLEEVLR